MTIYHLPTSPDPAPGEVPSPHELAFPPPLQELVWTPHNQRRPLQQQASPECFPGGMRWDTAEHQEPHPSPAMSSQWQELWWGHRWTGSRCGVQRDGGSAEHGAVSQAHDAHNGGLLSSKADTETHDTDNIATLPSVAPLPFLSGISNPVPPEGYRETSVGTGQLLAVSSVISYICPSIGCRCQFRPNRCMAVVSNEKSHLFLLEAEMKLPSHGGWGGRWGGNTGVQVSSVQRVAPAESSCSAKPSEGTGTSEMTEVCTLPRRTHNLVDLGGSREGGFRSGICVLL